MRHDMPLGYRYSWFVVLDNVGTGHVFYESRMQGNPQRRRDEEEMMACEGHSTMQSLENVVAYQRDTSG